MYYAPHTIEKKIAPVITMDDFGRPRIDSDIEEWQVLGVGRCDKTTEDVKKSDNGEAFVPTHKIVIGFRGKVVAGDIVRARIGEKILCNGLVRSVKENNLLNYSELWVSE